VALDGSRLSEASLPVAARLAHALGGGLTLLHVLESHPPHTVHGEPHLQGADAARSYLEAVAARLRSQGLTVDVRVLEDPVRDVAGSIAAQAAELAADVVVLAAHGWGGLRARLLGHVPQQVLVRGSRPVLLVPAPATFQDIRSVLAPVDPEGEAQAALPWAEEIAVRCSARLHLVTVVPTPATVPPEGTGTAVFLPQATGAVLDLASEQAHALLRRLQASLRGRGLAAEIEVRRGDVVRELTAAVKEHRPDLLVMATHARGGWDSLWAGSVAARLAPALTVPVLFVPVRGAADA
jgi:nucleotide-binding universal stress UspA family protein